MKNLFKGFCLITLIFLTQSACGVKGDPVPPKIPAELGRGQPTYKGATEDLAFPSVPPVYTPTPKEEAKKNKESDEKKQ